MIRKVLGVLLLMAALNGCATRNLYTAPPSLTSASGATVTGSREENPHLLIKDMRTGISSIDGLATGLGTLDWDQPILVTPGKHMVQVYSRYGQSGGGIATQMAFEAGKTYAVQGQRKGQHAAMVWLVDKTTGVAVSEKFAVCLMPDAPIAQLFSSC